MNFKNANRYRKARGRILRVQIDKLRSELGRDIKILDIGGRREYWDNLSLEGISRIEILNYDEGELEPDDPTGMFVHKVGDARNLSQCADKSVDLVHSNSVIEHVGSWDDMTAMAQETLRIGKSGWVQTPAWEFPIEPHFRTPFVHWIGQPLRRKLLWLSPNFRKQTISERRHHVDRINLLSRSEVETLFPGSKVITERFLMLPKSYVASW